jgi:hypothetical protein
MFLLELSNDRRICWSRPRAASSAEQRFKIHRSLRRHAALLEKCRRRMGLESRVASRRDYMESDAASNRYVSLPAASRSQGVQLTWVWRWPLPERRPAML